MPEFIQSGYCNTRIGSIIQRCDSGQINVRVFSKRDDNQALAFAATLLRDGVVERERLNPAAEAWINKNLPLGVYRLEIKPATGSRHHDYRHLDFEEDFSTSVEVLGNDTVNVDALIGRKDSILYDIPYEFMLADTGRFESEPPWNEFTAFSEVSANATHIAASAKRFAVSSDLIKSTIFMETTHGFYDRIADPIGLNRTIRPMNVHAVYWGRLFSRAYLADSRNNIDAGTFLLSRIATRIPDESIRKIATIYNSLGAETVSDYGVSVERIYTNRSFVPSETWFETIQRDIGWFENLDPLEQVRILRRMFGGY